MIEYLSENLWQLWAVIAVLGLILELSSGDFFIMCFAIGAFGAAVASPFMGFMLQLIVFIVVSMLSLMRIRPFALRFLHRGEEQVMSNADAVVGQVGRVSESIQPGGYGRVAVCGDDWKAMSVEADEIPVGTAVKVVARNSVIITVTNEF